MKQLEAIFYKSESGTEPVRYWLLSLSKEDKKTIGEDVKTVQIGWPLGMPLVRSLGDGLWEVRSNLINGRISRIIFFMDKGAMILLNGFVKKSKKPPLKSWNWRKNVESFTSATWRNDNEKNT